MVSRLLPSTVIAEEFLAGDTSHVLAARYPLCHMARGAKLKPIGLAELLKLLLIFNRIFRVNVFLARLTTVLGLHAQDTCDHLAFFAVEAWCLTGVTGLNVEAASTGTELQVSFALENSKLKTLLLIHLDVSLG
jgi:hypothetical protein